MGDHGPRTSDFRSTHTGKMEERLSMLSITYPPKLERYKKLVNNLRTNSQLMTSHFDLYSTFQHITTFPNLNENVHKHKYGRSLFTNIAKLNRSCSDAGVDNHWCSCLYYEKVDAAEDKHVLKIVQKIIDFINRRNAKVVPEMCDILRVKDIRTAGRRKPSTEMNQFQRTKTKGEGCDTCAVVLDKNKHFSRFVYTVTFSAYPTTFKDSVNPPAYEADAEVVVNTDGSVGVDIDPEISRVNLYGDQPQCIAKEYPHLRSYCVCMGFKGQ